MEKKITLKFKVKEIEIEAQVVAESQFNYILEFSKDDLFKKLLSKIRKCPLSIVSKKLKEVKK